jgi:branched-chain amino acid transport system permease protein
MRAIFGNRQFLALFFLLMALLPIVANPYLLYVANLILIYVILAVGLNILFGFAGQFTLANAAIFGIGAYATGLLETRLGLPYVIAAPGGAVIAMLMGTTITLPALRLSGVHLALSTLAFAMFTQWVLLHWNMVTSGGGGFPVPNLSLGPLPIGPDHAIYWLSWIVCLGLVAFAWCLLRSRIGRGFVAIRDGEIAAQMLGIDPIRYKALAFAISGLYAGIAGALYAPLLGYVSPEGFDLFQMVLQKSMIVIGGVGSVIGAVIGAIIIVIALEALREVQWTQEILFGCVLIGFVLFRPGGIAVFLQKLPGWGESVSSFNQAKLGSTTRDRSAEPRSPPIARAADMPQ